MSAGPAPREQRLVAPGSAPESAPAGHGTVLPGAARDAGRLARMRPDLLVRSQRPGVVPLTKLGLGEVVDGALRTVRRSTGAVLGMGLLVSVVPTLVTALLSWLLRRYSTLARFDLAVFSVAATAIAALFAGLVLSGLLAPVVHEAALGRRATLGRAWALTAGRRGRILLAATTATTCVVLATALPAACFWGLAVLAQGGRALALAALGSPAACVGGLWSLVRTAAAPACVALEQQGVVSSHHRAWYLTRGLSTQVRLVVWFALASLAAALAISMLLAGLLAAILVISHLLLVDVSMPEWLREPVSLVAGALRVLVPIALSTPYLACVLVLAYLDRRFELEGYDVALVRRFQDEAARVPRR